MTSQPPFGLIQCLWTMGSAPPVLADWHPLQCDAAVVTKMLFSLWSQVANGEGYPKGLEGEKRNNKLDRNTVVQKIKGIALRERR